MRHDDGLPLRVLRAIECGSAQPMLAGEKQKIETGFSSGPDPIIRRI
jgi:hypothetical protein